MRLSSCQPSATVRDTSSLIRMVTRCQLTSSLSYFSAPAESTSALMQGSGVLVHSANAFWVTLMNLSAVSRLTLSQVPLAMIELPYGFTPASFHARKPMSLPSSRANTWWRLKNDVVASMVLALSAPSLALASILTQVTDAGSMPTFLASAGHMVRAPSPAGLPIFLPARSFTPVMPELLSQ